VRAPCGLQDSQFHRACSAQLHTHAICEQGHRRRQNLWQRACLWAGQRSAALRSLARCVACVPSLVRAVQQPGARSRLGVGGAALAYGAFVLCVAFFERDAEPARRSTVIHARSRALGCAARAWGVRRGAWWGGVCLWPAYQRIIGIPDAADSQRSACHAAGMVLVLLVAARRGNTRGGCSPPRGEGMRLFRCASCVGKPFNHAHHPTRATGAVAAPETPLHLTHNSHTWPQSPCVLLHNRGCKQC
jgi:hypothetical protein